MTTLTPEQTDAPDEKSVVARLRDACNGRPSTLIPWPHRVLHDAAARIEELEAALAKLAAGTHVLVPVEPTGAMVASAFGWREWDTPDDWFPEACRFYGAYRSMLAEAAQEGK